MKTKNYLIDGKQESERLNFQNKIDVYNLDQELNHFQWKTDQHVLDAGCGNGNVIEQLNSKKIKSIDGIDFSTDRINIAKERFSNNPNIRFHLGTLENTKLKSESFDTIISRYIYEHVLNPLEIMNEMKRLLKPGGNYYIINFDDVVFNFHTKNEALNNDLKRIKSSIPQDIEIGRKIPQYLKQIGFQEVEWSAQTYFFQGERLSMEKENSRMRFELAKDSLSSYFPSRDAYDLFVKSYLDELDDDCNVMFMSKFLIKARKNT